jgi:hypothetical protein
MARRLLYVIDGVLLVAAIFLAVRLYQAWTVGPPSVPPEPAPAVQADAPTPPAAVQTRPPLTAYATVAERNLFSPTRNEAPPEPPRSTAGTGVPAPPAPKPRLYGIVLLPEGRGRAYLEDVQRRRVVGFTVGDLVGDARLEQIKGDRVVLRRGGETFEVLLHDPSKPRQTAAPPGVQSPEAGGTGRPAVGRPPSTIPSAPPAGLRAPGRPRMPTPPPPPPPSSDGQEQNEEE